ncbi:FAD-dependent oxidoreductase [Paenibacillus koleovorans]|uniref:FAD-dependent oxidoreductase n=1 Tax=Paenibacillus koleovorans TaxID=121608 RepID=UPI0013E2DB45|nr:FAD-dependent oxidoreductase [Paenibacillus koleovorans]
MKKPILGTAAAILVVLAALAAYRVQSKGIESLNLWKSKFDVVIIGTELEGIYLAKQAHDAGLDVKILEPTDTIGGQLLQGEMLYLDETFDDQGKSLLQGSIQELFTDYYEGEIRKLSDFKKYFNRQIKGIPLEKNAQPISLQIVGRKVQSLTYTTKSGRTKTVEADYFVDNSDSAELVSLTGAEPLPGLESLYQATQREYMSATYMMKFRNVDWERFYGSFWELTKPERTTLYGPETYVDANIGYGFPPIVARYQLQNPDKANLRGLNILNQKDGQVIINALQVYDVDPNKPETIAAAMQVAKQEMPHIRDLLRKYIIGFENAELNGEPESLYVREYNHYPTEYILEASDLLGGVMFQDNVSVGGYFIDIQGSRSNREGFAIGKPDKYGIPLRSYLLKDVDNVILTGKMVGASYVAYGSARIQPNGALAAESIGLLLARNPGINLKQVTDAQFADFHAYMKEQHGIVLNPSPGNSKIVGMTPQDIEELNRGHITLLSNAAQARTLPFIRVFFDNQEVKFTAHRPVIIDGKTWSPADELLKAFGASYVRLDLDKREIVYQMPGSNEMKTISTSLNILNNRVLVNLREISEQFGYKATWDNLNRMINIYSNLESY